MAIFNKKRIGNWIVLFSLRKVINVFYVFWQHWRPIGGSSSNRCAKKALKKDPPTKKKLALRKRQCFVSVLANAAPHFGTARHQRCAAKYLGNVRDCAKKKQQQKKCALALFWLECMRIGDRGAPSWVTQQAPGVLFRFGIAHTSNHKNRVSRPFRD